MVAVRGRGGGIDEPLHPRASRGRQHLEEAADIDRIRGDRILERARDASECCLMQDKVNSLARASASIGIANVALAKAESAPLSGRHETLHLLKICAVP